MNCEKCGKVVSHGWDHHVSDGVLLCQSCFSETLPEGTWKPPHRASPQWIPAFLEHHLICTKCGRNLTLLDGVELKDVVFELEGECEPGETLSVHVQDGIGVKDRFGG